MKNTYTGKTRLFLCISAVIVLVALVMQIAGIGLNLGIDFTGGSLLNYSVGEAYDVKDVESILTAAGFEGSQVTKAAQSEASKAIQDKIAADAAAAVEEAAAEETASTEEAAAEETAAAEEAAAEETAAAEEAPATTLNTDKSGIVDDGLTDLQIRMNLVDNTAGMEDAIAAAVTAAVPAAAKTGYVQLTNSIIVNKGIDSSYAGGYMAEFTVGSDFDKDAVISAVETALKDAGYPVTAVTAVRYDAAAEAKAAEEAAEVTEETSEEETEAPAEETAEAVEETGNDLRVLVNVDDPAAEVRSNLEQQMVAKYPNFRFVSIDHVSAVAGHDLLSNAVKALLIAFACMLLYIAVRFDVFSGLAALFGLLHDVLIMCSFMVFFRGLFQVNSSFIAAILTIVGYSINNTIIIFDRIRETAKKPGFSQAPRKEIVEVSVSQTISRTVNTTLTTLITLVALYICGVDSIREFAFPLIVGMLAGTYSSVLLSGQVWAGWMEKVMAKRATKKGAKKA